MLYNTLDGEYIKATDEDELKFIAALLDKKKLWGNESHRKKEWQCDAIRNLLTTARDKFFADLYECSLSEQKPIQFYPILNLQEEVGRLQNFSSVMWELRCLPTCIK